MKFKELLASVKEVFSDRIWLLNGDEMSSAKARFVRLVKLAMLTVNTFAENRMGFQCVALSYFGALAIVPSVAVIFAVTGGLGLTDKLEALLYNFIPTNTDLIDMLLDKAGNIINTARSGGVGLVSALFFVWTIIWLLFQVERVFNNVWGIRKVPRKLYKRFSFYIVFVLLAPFVVLIFGAGIAAYSNLSSYIGLNFVDYRVIGQILAWLIFYVIVVFTLSAMYKFIPAAKVIYKHSLKAALITGFVFVVFQYLYLETQVFVTRLNGVYGAIAAVPLFLIWMNFSWQIIIYGAQLGYAFQHVDNYNLDD